MPYLYIPSEHRGPIASRHRLQISYPFFSLFVVLILWPDIAPSSKWATAGWCSEGGINLLVTFDNWINGRAITALGTNAGAQALPFQGWRNFKEAFAPELVARAVGESAIAVKRCIDPFSGSGTTALACQFLGIHPTFIEVNPYLARPFRGKSLYLRCTYAYPRLLEARAEGELHLTGR